MTAYAAKKNVYILENLDCANCAAKMESKINAIPGVEHATVIFPTKQLHLYADNPQELLTQIQKACSQVEADVKVIPKSVQIPAKEITKVYIVENLDCANCAAKVERGINHLPGVVNATLTFATKQLRLTAKDPDVLLPFVREVCESLEPGVTVTPHEELVHTRIVEKPSFFIRNKSLLEIICGAALFAFAQIFGEQLHPGILLSIYLVSYLILGGKILLTATKNIARGRVFDENFLMSIATLGAFAIGEYAEGVGVMLFYRVGEFFEERAVAKSRSQIMDAVDLRPEVVNLVQGDTIRVIGAASAKVSDILLVRPGDRIPLDGIVVDGESRIDTSPITGEPVPVKANIGGAVTSGCMNLSGVIKIRVEKVLEDSMVTRILNSVENAAASKPKIDRFITRFSRIYTPFVVFLALGTAIIPSLITGDWNHWIYTALTFLVISCPCALVLSVPLAFFSGIGAGSKRGILFKGGVALEALKNIGAVVMDKTGTITHGNFQVQQVISANHKDSTTLLSYAAACEQSSTHPIAVSILEYAKQENATIETPESVTEIAGKGIKAHLNGKEILCGNTELMKDFQIDLSAYHKEHFGSEVLVSVDGIYFGYLVISDTLKEDAAEAIKRLKSLGVTTAMLTGDALDSAMAVAEKIGIDEVHAKLLPEDKLSELQKIRSAHGKVMFVGDGINDAPVLAGADVGAAMGSGADAAIEAADVVFMNSNVSAIPQAIDIARVTGQIAIQNVAFALIIKAIVMVLGLTGYASMWMAVFADSGVAVLCVLNAIRVLYRKS